MSKAGTTLDQAIEAVYELHVGVVGQSGDRHERPHKPVMILAVIDLVAAGLATPERISWSPELRARFARYFEIVQRLNDKCTPENPFLYLRKEKWWKPMRNRDGNVGPLESQPTVRDAVEATVFARLTEPVASWLGTASHREKIRQAIVSRFFPQAREQLNQLFDEAIVGEADVPGMAANGADSLVAGRSAAFRRTILKVYDFQCAACGLRIRMPEAADLTFVDAAHLIPFSDRELGGNDHPTNGLALCKNHHWAMDRFLIAPTPERVWRASPRLVSRRSQGELELQKLDGQELLPPHEPAFYPDKASLQWRADRLMA